MKIASTEEMRRIEREADSHGLTYASMMENAGRCVAQEIRSRLGVEGRFMLILVGPGNNGGDGLVAARHLHDAGAKVQLYLWKRALKDDENFRLTQERDIPYTVAEKDAKLAHLADYLTRAEIVVDALLGTGVSLPLRGLVTEILDALRGARRRGSGHSPHVVAVDVPSGVDCDTGAVDPATVSADLTVTFALPKKGFYIFPGAGYLGKLVVGDIGVPPSLTADLTLELAEQDLVKALLPSRPRDANKGTFGKALIVAGSPNYTGAAFLASAAATRVGTGLVTLCVAQSLHPILASKLTEVTFLLLPHDLGALVPQAIKLIEERLPDYHALLVGPGLGLEDSTVEFVHLLLRMQSGDHRRQIGFVGSKEQRGGQQEGPKGFPPLVIDADGLNSLARLPDWWESLTAEAILTPHPGEMSRLMDCSVEEVQSDRVAVARTAAEQWHQTVILKGAHSIVAAPDGRVVVSPFANPGLASAGTGDVLAGSVVGLLAQGLSPFEAAVAGVYLHGAAGEMAAAKMGDAGMVASDLLPLLPQVIRQTRADH
ncbi:MAG TPA: NAD(P)H-hydrate dehydratase [Chloroflexi bacterium]|nr:NAD(P)H-hydrate dehydratase [Chloroflexota bacterium]